MVIHKVYSKVKKLGLSGVLRYIPHWVNETYHERRLGIDTRGYMDLESLGLEQYAETSGAYEPVTYSSLIRALNFLKIRDGADVFLDYGSGKGRAILVAAAYPFKRVTGVDLSEKLNEIARDNLQRARSKLRCSQVEILAADAVTYQPADDVTVVFLYGPFFGEPMQAVIRALAASRARAPREITVIYKYPAWTEDPFSQDKDYRLLKEDIGYSSAGERLRIYRAG